MSAAREWFSAGELAEIGFQGMPSTKAGMLKLAHRAGWLEARRADGSPLHRARQGRGGGVEFHYTLVEFFLFEMAASASRECAWSVARLHVWIQKAGRHE